MICHGIGCIVSPVTEMMWEQSLMGTNPILGIRPVARLKERDRKREREMEREKGRMRQIERERDRQTDRQTEHFK